MLNKEMDICGIEVPEEILWYILSYNILPYTRGVNSALMKIENSRISQMIKQLIKRYGTISKTYYSGDLDSFIYLVNVAPWLLTDRKRHYLSVILTRSILRDQDRVSACLRERGIVPSIIYSLDRRKDIPEEFFGMMKKGILSYRQGMRMIYGSLHQRQLTHKLLRRCPVDELISLMPIHDGFDMKMTALNMLVFCRKNIDRVTLASIYKKDTFMTSHIVMTKPQLNIDRMLEMAVDMGCVDGVQDFLNKYGYR
jgi:hypothetical protein